MSDDRLEWFPCYPSKLLGALAAMKPDEGYVYWIVCLRIYETGKPCPDTLDALARRTGLNRRRVSDALDRLFRSGKLVREGDAIMNPFAAEVIAHSHRLHGERVRAGREGASRRWRKTQENQTNEYGKPNAHPIANDAHLHLQLPLESEVPLESESRRSKRRSPRQQIPEDWKPDEKGIAYARERRFDDAKIGMMVRACRDYHIKHGTLIAGEKGLAATWRTWVENEIKFSKPKPQPQWAQQRDDAESYLKSMRERATDGRDNATQADRAAIPGPSVPRIGGDVHSRPMAPRVDPRPIDLHKIDG